MSQPNTEFVTEGTMSPISVAMEHSLIASETAYRGRFLTLSPSTGYASENDGTVPNQIAGGVAYPAEQSNASATAGVAKAQAWTGSGAMPFSTITNDGFDATDVCTPFFIVNETTPGKKSNHSGSNRSLGGLVLGLAKTGVARIWSGPVAQLLARSALVVNAKVGGWYAHPVDGAANTATAEKTIHREPLHGVITAIKFDTLGTVAADATDYLTITVYKRDGAGGSAVAVGSYSSATGSEGAIAAGVPATFTLSAVSGAINLLETDLLTYAVTKGGSGKVLPVGTLRVIQKVI